MITGDQIERCWQSPIPAIKKLDWHDKWRAGIGSIPVLITGFRVEGKYLKVYYSYTSPTTGKTMHDLDTSEQFKL